MQALTGWTYILGKRPFAEQASHELQCFTSIVLCRAFEGNLRQQTRNIENLMLVPHSRSDCTPGLMVVNTSRPKRPYR